MPNFCCDLTRIVLDYFWLSCWYLFTESCLQAAHSVGSTRGQREIEQPSEPRSWIAQSLPSGMWSALTLWWHLWIVFTIFSKHIIGDIFTAAPVLFRLDWFVSSTPTLRWCRMVITDWYFNPLLVAISSLLIPRSSVTSSECLSLSCLAVLIMR
jgi:hypothetical protein